MARSPASYLSICLVLAVLPAIALGVAESHGKIIRTESKSSSLHLSPHGEMIEEKSKPELTMKAGTYAAATLSTTAAYACNLADTCNCDFPESDKADPQPNSDGSGCRAVTSTTGKAATPVHRAMDEAGLCQVAAEKAAAHTLTNPQWEADCPGIHCTTPRPMGCYKYPSCPNSASGVCYGYNTIAAIADSDTAQVTGTPVCVRNKFEMATPDTEGDTTCPEEYEAIHDEFACRHAVTCLGKKCLDTQIPFQFMVGKINASRTADYPQGCFILGNCGYYNKVNSAIPRTGSVKGTSICRVSTTTCHGTHNGTHCVSTAAAAAASATTAAPAS